MEAQGPRIRQGRGISFGKSFAIDGEKAFAAVVGGTPEARGDPASGFVEAIDRFYPAGTATGGRKPGRAHLPGDGKDAWRASKHGVHGDTARPPAQARRGGWRAQVRDSEPARYEWGRSSTACVIVGLLKEFL